MDYSRLKQLIDETGVAMLTTVEADGSFRSRPMLTGSCILSGEPGKSEIWFITGENSPKADEILQDPRVSVTYSDTTRMRHISVSGSCEVVHDPVRLERFWRPEFRTWFPEGTRSELALLRVIIDRVELWERPVSRLNPLRRAIGIASRREHHERADLKAPRVIGTRKAS